MKSNINAVGANFDVIGGKEKFPAKAAVSLVPR